MNAITLGNPNLFVKGMVEVVVTDPESGNIIGYDNVASESAVTTSVNMGEITGGIGNPLLINIPDTTRISGSLTSQAFSLQQRALMTGGAITYNSAIPYCETITANASGIINPTKAPVSGYGQTNGGDPWCYVREHGATTYTATAYTIQTIAVGNYKVNGFTGVSGKQYDVFYFTNMIGAQTLALPSNFNPSVASVRLKYAVYAKQNNSVSNGTLQGYLYFIVPRAQFTGDAGIGASQTNNSTTAYDWIALTPDNNMMDCVSCNGDASDYAYYIYVPCTSTLANVKDIAIIGGDISGDYNYLNGLVLSVVLIMDNNTVITPNYSDLDFSSTGSDNITVDKNGKLSCNQGSGGTSTVTVTLQRSPEEGGNLSDSITVTYTP